MDAHSRSPPSTLFTLRVWHEDLGAGRSEWRGRLQNTVSGEVRYFQGWKALVEVLFELLVEESGE